MYFTGEFIDANEAYRLGAVERVVPRDQLVEAARSIAAKIAEKSPIMISLAKEALNGIEDGNLEDKYRSEQGFTPPTRWIWIAVVDRATKAQSILLRYSDLKGYAHRHPAANPTKVPPNNRILH